MQRSRSCCSNPCVGVCSQRHAQPRRHKYIKQARSSGYGEAGSVLCIGLFAHHHFQLYNINPSFHFAFWAEKWKPYKDSICIYLCPGLIPAYRARHPTGKLICFHHRFSCYIECRSALNVWLLSLTNINRTRSAGHLSAPDFISFFAGRQPSCIIQFRLTQKYAPAESAISECV